MFTETEGQLRKRVDDENNRDDSEDYAVNVDAGKRWRRSLVARRALSFPRVNIVVIVAILRIASTHLIKRVAGRLI